MRYRPDGKKGLFISFEGVEGSGKTTQIRSLASWLKKRGVRTLLTREPGGTPLANRVRSILLDSKTQGLSPTMELLLYQIARRDHLSQLIQPALKKGLIVLCDRFTDATLAYQGYGRGIPLKNVELLNQIATGGLKPNRTFLLDLPVEIGLRRARERIQKRRATGKKEDRFEREAVHFHRKVRNGYLTLARKEKRRFRIINAREPRRKILVQLCREVEKILRDR